MTAVAIEHTSWCVRKHDRGACSSKRGKWSRSTNTWSSDLTEHDRKLIKNALRWWRQGDDAHTVMTNLRASSTAAGGTLGSVEDSALLTWNMTQKRMEKQGKSWPI